MRGEPRGWSPRWYRLACHDDSPLMDRSWPGPVSPRPTRAGDPASRRRPARAAGPEGVFVMGRVVAVATETGREASWRARRGSADHGDRIRGLAPTRGWLDPPEHEIAGARLARTQRAGTIPQGCRERLHLTSPPFLLASSRQRTATPESAAECRSDGNERVSDRRAANPLNGGIRGEGSGSMGRPLSTPGGE